MKKFSIYTDQAKGEAFANYFIEIADEAIEDMLMPGDPHEMTGKELLDEFLAEIDGNGGWDDDELQKFFPKKGFKSYKKYMEAVISAAEHFFATSMDHPVYFPEI